MKINTDADEAVCVFLFFFFFWRTLLHTISLVLVMNCGRFLQLFVFSRRAWQSIKRQSAIHLVLPPGEGDTSSGEYAPWFGLLDHRGRLEGPSSAHCNDQERKVNGFIWGGASIGVTSLFL